MRKTLRTEKQPTEILRRLLSHKTHRVYAKSYARKTVVVLAFRPRKVQRNQGVLRPHQAGVGIYVLPPRVTRKLRRSRQRKLAKKSFYRFIDNVDRICYNDNEN